jgi:hypothetical protein
MIRITLPQIDLTRIDSAFGGIRANFAWSRLRKLHGRKHLDGENYVRSNLHTGIGHASFPVRKGKLLAERS